MKEQQEFDLALKRPFSPSAGRQMPVLWIEEVRVYRSYDRDALQCRYPLRRGLNMLWADPGPGNMHLYERGVRGHAAGKTTFCRLLRYLLGEPTYGTEHFQQTVVNWEPNALVVGKVWVDGTAWIACRPMGLDKRDFAFEGQNIENVFAPPNDVAKYSDFLELLAARIEQPLTARELPYGHQLTWRYILPWLSRDQECRLAHLLDWRDPITESQRPDMTNADACYVIRSVMGLITKAEEDTQRQHRELLATRKELEASVPLLRHQATESLKTARSWASDQALEGDLLFANIRQTLRREAAAISDSPELARAVQRRHDARSQVEARIAVETTRRDDLKLQKAQLETDRRELQLLRGEVTRHQARADMADEAPAPSGRCNVPLRVAEARGCHLARGRKFDFESHKNVDGAKAELDAYETVVREDEQAVASMQRALDQASAALESARREQASAEKAYQALRTDADRRTGIVEQRLDDVDAAEAACNKAETKSTELATVKRDLDASQRKQEELRRAADEKRTRVNELFEDIIQAVLGDDVNATFIPHAQNIELRVECHGERTSAATETVKILCMDIAAMLLSAEGFGHHPRFLIHDSPREADLANDIYQRFFLYMEELEKAFPNAAPNYQHIITTTEPPPEHLQKRPWLIAKLDASRAGGRVLKVDLGAT